MYRPEIEIKESQKEVKTIKPADARQADILANMYYAACSAIGSLENITYDYDEDGEEYINAKKELSDHRGLVDSITVMCLTGYHGCGFAGPQRAYQKNYNLAGNKFINQCAEEVVKALGY